MRGGLSGDLVAGTLTWRLPLGILSGMKTNGERKVTAKAAAKLLRLTPSRVRQLAGAGEIVAEKVHSPVGEYWLIDRREVLRVKAARVR